MNKQKEQEKIDKYNEKQNQMLSKQKEKEENKKKDQEERIEQLRQRDIELQKKLLYREQKEQEWKDKILEEMQKKETYVQKHKEKNAYDNLIKAEEATQQRIMMNEKQQALSRKQANNREELYQEIMNKNKRVENFLKEKELEAEKKKKMQEDIAKKKEMYTNEMQKIFAKKEINENTVKKLKELFPDNPEINELLQNYHDTNTMNNTMKSSNKNNMLYSSSGFHKKQMNKTQSGGKYNKRLKNKNKDNTNERYEYEDELEQDTK